MASLILDFLVNGKSQTAILAACPQLQPDDIRAGPACAAVIAPIPVAAAE